MAILDKKISAFSLIEALVAMVIIMISFGIGMMVYFNIIKSEKSQIKLQATINSENIFIETRQLKSYENDEYHYKNHNIIKTVTNYGNSNNLYLVTLNVVDKNQKEVTSFNEIMIE